MSRVRDYFLGSIVAEEGLYHSDLQPGNMLADPTTDTVWILDYGQMGRLNASQRAFVQSFVGACLAADATMAVEVLEQMGMQSSSYNRAGLGAAVHTAMASWEGDVTQIAPVIAKIFSLCHAHGLDIELPYMHLLKGIATFEAAASYK